MAGKAKETEERQVLNLNERQFYKDSISDEGNGLIQNIGVIDQELASAQLQVDIIRIAKDSLIKTLEELSTTFEEVTAEVEKSA